VVKNLLDMKIMEFLFRLLIFVIQQIDQAL